MFPRDRFPSRPFYHFSFFAGSGRGGGGVAGGVAGVQIDKSPGLRSMRQLLPCVTTDVEEEREVRGDQLDWSLYTALFLRDDEGKK